MTESHARDSGGDDAVSISSSSTSSTSSTDSAGEAAGQGAGPETTGSKAERGGPPQRTQRRPRRVQAAYRDATIVAAHARTQRRAPRVTFGSAPRFKRPSGDDDVGAATQDGGPDGAEKPPHAGAGTAAKQRTVRGGAWPRAPRLAPAPKAASGDGDGEEGNVNAWTVVRPRAPAARIPPPPAPVAARVRDEEESRPLSTAPAPFGANARGVVRWATGEQRQGAPVSDVGPGAYDTTRAMAWVRPRQPAASVVGRPKEKQVVAAGGARSETGGDAQEEEAAAEPEEEEERGDAMPRGEGKEVEPSPVWDAKGAPGPRWAEEGEEKAGEGKGGPAEGKGGPVPERPASAGTGTVRRSGGARPTSAPSSALGRHVSWRHFAARRRRLAAELVREEELRRAGARPGAAPRFESVEPRVRGAPLFGRAAESRQQMGAERAATRLLQGPAAWGDPRAAQDWLATQQHHPWAAEEAEAAATGGEVLVRSAMGVGGKGTAVMRREGELPVQARAARRAREAAETRRPFYRVQAHSAWEEAEEGGARASAVAMDRQRGRDVVRAGGGGDVDVVPFGAPPAQGEEGTDAVPGPGAYGGEAEPAPRRGLGLEFGRMVGRDDATGPHGERPAAAEEAERAWADEGQALDLDPDRALRRVRASAPVYSFPHVAREPEGGGAAADEDGDRLVLEPREEAVRPAARGHRYVGMATQVGREAREADGEGDVLELSPRREAVEPRARGGAARWADAAPRWSSGAAKGGAEGEAEEGDRLVLEPDRAVDALRRSVAGGVAMGRAVGREAGRKAEESGDVGEGDALALDAEAAREALRGRAWGGDALRMERQPERWPAEAGGGAGGEEEAELVLDVEGARRALQRGGGGGAVPFSRQGSRWEGRGFGEAGEQEAGEGDVLSLSVDRALATRFRRQATLVDMGRQEEGRPSPAGRRRPEGEGETLVLDVKRAEAAMRGGHPGRGGGVPMAAQRGRSPVGGGEEEEGNVLALEVDDAATRPRVRGGAGGSWSRAPGRDERSGAQGEGEGDVLVLEPRRAEQAKRGGAAWATQRGRSPGTWGKGGGSEPAEGDVLALELDDGATRRRSGGGAVAMRQPSGRGARGPQGSSSRRRLAAASGRVAERRERRKKGR